MFNFEFMSGKSSAFGGLFIWTENIYKYQEKIEQVVPMKKKAGEAKALADEMQKKLDIALKDYNEIMTKVTNLRNERDSALANAAQLEDLLSRYNLQLNNSGVLIDSLEGEYKRWNESVAKLSNSVVNLVGDVFLAASSLSYYGPFTGYYRELLVNQWKDKVNKLNLPGSDDYELHNILSNNLEVRDWKVYNLPSDKVSICNACLATRSLRYPIIIDPQELAYLWLSKLGNSLKVNHDESNQFRSIKYGDKKMIKTIGQSIESGWIVLLYDCPEKLDNNVDQLLLQKANSVGIIKSENTNEIVTFDGKEIPVHEQFRIYLCTKIGNPA